MNPDKLYKIERDLDKINKKAEERRRKGFYEGAAIAYLEAAELLSKNQIFPKRAAGYYNNVGLAYRVAKKYHKAEKYLQTSLSIREKEFGEEHHETASSWNNLGSLYLETRQFDQSKKCLQKSLRIRKKILEKNDPAIATSLNNLGSLYAGMGKMDMAYSYFKRAKNIIETPSTNIKVNDFDAIINNYQNAQKEISDLERERNEIQAALYQSKKLEYLGQMSTMMAHNINQPISIIRMATSGALSDVNDKLFNAETELKPLLEKILNQTERLSLIMSNFRLFARGDRSIRSEVNLNNIIEDIYQLLFASQYGLNRIDFKKDLIESPIAFANEFAIQEMLISLLSNARVAVKDKKVKQVRVITWQQDKQVGFNIEDNGDGVNPKNLPKLFTPFLSSKNDGMGLGLYFCKEIVKDLGGTIEYYTAPLGGAGFKISLPTTQDSQNDSPV